MTLGPLSGNRFLTLNSVIRVNQVEGSRDATHGSDEYEQHTPERVAAFRAAFAEGWPGAPLTWAWSWLALFDERLRYRRIREMMADYHERYGDDVTFIPGGFFANRYGSRAQVSRDLHEALARVDGMMGGGFRPKSVVAGFLAAENQRFLAEEEDIHVCQGNIWSQFAIDNQDGDGAISYPYYPSREHFCKPAQGRADFLDCVNLDGWTCDFLAARREGFKEGFNSRLGVGPIETLGTYGSEVGLRQMLWTTAAHFDTGFALNGWAWITNCWEISLVAPIGRLDCLTKWCREIRRRWPGARCLTQGDFGLLWRRQYKDNRDIDYRFVQRGSGIGGSDADKEIRWFMNKDFRLALLRDLAGGPEKVIDFTRYDRPAHEPADGATHRRWSLLGDINQKQTRPQDKPVPLAKMPAKTLERILARYPELKA